jgi:hypothetical protein
MNKCGPLGQIDKKVDLETDKIRRNKQNGRRETVKKDIMPEIHKMAEGLTKDLWDEISTIFWDSV